MQFFLRRLRLGRDTHLAGCWRCAVAVGSDYWAGNPCRETASRFWGAPGFTLIAGVMIVLGVGLAGAWPSVMNGSALQPNSRTVKRRIIAGNFLFSVKKSRLASAALVKKTLCAESDQEPLPSGRLPTLAPRASSFFFMFFGLLLFFWPWHFEQTFLLP